jgi:hypothetical protein
MSRFTVRGESARVLEPFSKPTCHASKTQGATLYGVFDGDEYLGIFRKRKSDAVAIAEYANLIEWDGNTGDIEMMAEKAAAAEAANQRR